jgi:lipopolysaccharide transport system ATP-binding protein
MKPIIEVNQVWKSFYKGKDRRYKSLRDSISNLPKNILKNSNQEEFFALENINFNVNPGESLGIIGRNGAGKSTLLKILSRITPPTKGEVILRGRVASLLEVGTGFHPELTGRENIYFNGSILGMKYLEIKQKFDEIVDFSGVESFIETPLKHYSSGMQMRLAFSVAAHLNSEILLVDEVLAVGDAEFQKKCIGKMDDVSKGEGKTILFVSHNLRQLELLCTSSIILRNGSNSRKNNTVFSIDEYNNSFLKERPIDIASYSNDAIKINQFELKNTNNTNIKIGEKLVLSLSFELKNKYKDLSIALNIKKSSGELMAHISNEDDSFYITTDSNSSIFNIEITTDPIFLNSGKYIIDLWFGLFHTTTILSAKDILYFTIEQGDITPRKTELPIHAKTYIKTTWNNE